MQATTAESRNRRKPVLMSEATMGREDTPSTLNHCPNALSGSTLSSLINYYFIKH